MTRAGPQKAYLARVPREDGAMEFTCTLVRNPTLICKEMPNNTDATNGLNAASVFCSEAIGWSYKVIKDDDDDAITIHFKGPDSEGGKMVHHDVDIWNRTLNRFAVKAKG